MESQATKPDFAYPKKVVVASREALDRALASGDDKLALRAALDMEIAQTMITADSTAAAMETLSDLTARLTDPVMQALGFLLQADIYREIYSNDRWTYDRREIPAEPLDANCLLWSGDQFRAVISSLTDRALEAREQLLARKLTDYRELIEIDRDSEPYYPTLYDFVAAKAIGLYQTVSTPQAEGNNSVADRIQSVYASLLAAHRDSPAPEIMNTLDRLRYTFDNSYSPSSEDDIPAEQLYTQECWNLYDRYSGSEWSCDVLLSLSERVSIEEFNSPQTRRLYEALERSIARFTTYWRHEQLRLALHNLTAPNLSIDFPTFMAPGRKAKVSADMSNMNEAVLDVYNVSNIVAQDDEYVQYNKINRSVRVTTVTLSAHGKAPFTEEAEGELILPAPGAYVLVPRAHKDLNIDRGYASYRVIRCSDLALFSFTARQAVAVSVDPVTGVPQSGVGVMRMGRGRQADAKIGKTDQLGLAVLDVDDRDGMIRAYPVKGKDKYGTRAYITPPSTDPGRSYRAQVYTSLPVYHPGDSVEWAAVIYSVERDVRRPEAGVRVRAELRDAGYAPVDTVELTTDDFGRLSSSFRLPSDGMTGYFNIILTMLPEDGSEYERRLTSCNFMVSDYKLPEFAVTVDPAQMDSPAHGDVTVCGRVMTYSGFPLSDCAVTASVSVGRRTRWMWGVPSDPRPFVTKQLTTGSDGRFVLQLPDSLLKSSPMRDGLYKVEFTVTSTSGETHSASTVFSLVKAYNIEVAADRAYDRSRPAEITLRLTDGKGRAADLPIRVVMLQDSTEKWSAELHPGKQQLDWQSLPSGTYELKALPVGYDSETFTSETVLYTLGDTRSPVSQLLWTPGSEVRGEGRKATLIYATRAPKQNVLMLVSDSTGLISRSWIETAPGVHTIDVEIPADSDRIDVTMITVCDMEAASQSFRVRSGRPEPKIQIEIESFRDHVVSGTTERWNIRISNQGEGDVRSALITRLYNAALDDIHRSDWSAIRAPQFVRGIDYRVPMLGNTYQTTYYAKQPTIKSWKSIEQPSWITYGESLYGAGGRVFFRSGRRMRNTMMMKSAAMVESATDDVELEEAEAVVEDKAMAMPALAANAVMADAGAGPMEEAAVTGANSSGEEEGDQSVPFAYRDGEVALAFFRPMLTTDSAGCLTIEFDLPEANTTWRLNALAYTRDLLSDLLDKETVASKAVMVSPNLPRFVRIGDRVTVESLVMNNSDTTLTVTTTAEYFNPSDGRIIATATATHTLSAGESATVPATAEVTEGPVLGFRVKSVSGVCSDGEQSLLGVLASSEPVIDSYPFYLSPSQKSYSTKLPKLKRGARVDLQFCQDPLWYVVAALPGLSTGELFTPEDAAVSIFTSSVAEGLLNDYPRIGEALQAWQASDRTESALESMLERNADLKIILLRATPWMLDAASDTERMSRLSLLFDRKAIRENRAAAVSLLEKLATPSGGWRWISQIDEPSLWATGHALSVFCRLEWLGYMPDDAKLRTLITNAVRYADGEEMKQYEKYPDSNYLNYSFVRNMIKSVPQPTGVQRIISSTVQKAIRDWKSYTLPDKGAAAILLADSGHKGVAAQILESVSEFAETSPERGMWWPSIGGKWYGRLNDLSVTALLLEAYDRVEPGSDRCELIAQWMILQKEGRDWGSGAASTMIIADILRVADGWLEESGEATVTLGGNPVAKGPEEQYTGTFRADLSDLNPSGARLEISRSGEGPAWGSVLCRYTEESSAIKAHSTDAVSIEKRYYRQAAGTDSYTDWKPKDLLRVGDKVKVDLIITVRESMDYVAVVDNRPASFEPVEQLPRPLWSEGICFYRENRDTSTRLFISHLPKGVYRLSYDMWVNNAGSYTSGVATIQSQYAPQMTAHSAGTVVTSER